MNTGKWYQEIDEWMDGHKDEPVADISARVRIPSISSPQSGNGEAPFGAACQKAMDAMLAMGQKYGFHTENYAYYVGAIGAKEKDWKNTIGLWNHLDVVPAGNGWQYAVLLPRFCRPFPVLPAKLNGIGPEGGNE